MKNRVSRVRHWLDLLAIFIALAGATLFFSTLLSSLNFTEGNREANVPLHYLGAFALAIVALGFGSLVVTSYRLIRKRTTNDIAELRELLEQHLLTVAAVLVGAALTLLFILATG
jgi:hypothetical protein